MKKFLSLTFALIMMMALAIPAFATDTPPVDPPEITTPTNVIMPRTSIFKDTATSTDGTWTSTKHAATSSNGNYIRYWHKNNTNEKVKVYLYRTDRSDLVYVSSMTVDANSQNSKVYFTPTAGSGTYRMVVEAYESGGEVNGDVSLAQYISNPDL